MYQGERFNSITHLVGAVLALVGVTVMVTLAAMDGGAVRILTLSIYGVTLFLLYLFSTLYHSLRGRAKRVFFSFHFSKPFKRRGVWEDGNVSDEKRSARVEGGKSMGAFVYFWTHEGETILMKVGLSEESIEDARARMLAEFPGWDFNQLRRASELEWKR